MAYSHEAIRQTRHLMQEHDSAPSDLVTIHSVMKAFPELIAALTEEQKEAILKRTKPARYAALAGFMSLMLSTTLGKRPERPPYGFEKVNHDFCFTRWDRLKASLAGTIAKDLTSLQPTTEFQETAKVVEVAGTLDPRRHIDLWWQMASGASTAADTMVTVLRDLPIIVEQHEAAASPPALAAIARRSLQLPTSLARRSVNNMMAAREAIKLDVDSPRALDEGMLDYRHFVPVQDLGRLVAFRFANLDELPYPEKLESNSLLDQLGHFEKVGDVPNNGGPTIGCPITLLPGMLGGLWNWTIDVVEQQGLWGQR